MTAIDEGPGRGAGGVVRSLRERATRGTIISLGGQFLAQLLRMISNLVLSRLLFPEAFGLMALVSLVLIAIEQIINIGTHSTVIRHERGDDPSFLDTAWTIQVGRGLIVWVGVSALAPLLASFYQEPQLASLLPVALLSLVIGSFGSMKIALLYRRLELGRRVAIELVAQVATIGVAITLAWIFHSVWALVIGGLVNQATRTVLSHTWIPGRRDRLGWDRSAARELISFGKWVFASSGFSFLAAQLDVAILGRLASLGDLGVYMIGMTVPNLLRELLGQVSGSVLMPALSEANRSGTSSIQRAYEATRRVTLPTAVVVTLTSVVIAPVFFGNLYDSRYADAGWIAQLGAFRLWFGYLQVTACSTLFAYGDARIWAVSSGLAAAVTLVGCIVGFQISGIVGLILGLSVGTFAGYVVAVIQLERHALASVRPEIGYALVAAGLAIAVLGAERITADLLPELIPGFRTLVCGTVIVGPFALWAGARALGVVRGARVRGSAPEQA